MKADLLLVGQDRLARPDMVRALQAAFPEWRVADGGGGGQITDAIRTSYEAMLRSGSPRWVVLELGVQDAWAESPVEAGRFSDNVLAMVRMTRATGADVVLVIPSVEGGTPRRYADILRRLAAENGILTAGEDAEGASTSALIDRIAACIRPLARAGCAVEARGDLPDLFRFSDGHRVERADDWPARRREMLEAVLAVEYGPLPPVPAKWRAVSLHPHRLSVYGAAAHDTVRLEFGPHAEVSWTADVLTPNRPGPYPCLLCGDGCWTGSLSPRIPELAVERGYRFILFNRCECAPDVWPPGDPNVFLSRLFPGRRFGAIAAWAWAYHRTLDYALSLPDTDAGRTAVFGHSRGGKTSLLAGATDERIALTGASGSGCGGAGCFRRLGPGSEKLSDILKTFPYWFDSGLRAWVDRERELPVDQHMVKALVAPRPLVTVEGLDDLWANPRGTWDTFAAARSAYRLLDAEDAIGIRYLPFKHSFGPPVWEAFFDFADWRFGGRRPSGAYTDNPFA